MTWHNIFLLPKTKVLIFENKNSHLGKYERKKISSEQEEQLSKLIHKLVISQ